MKRRSFKRSRRGAAPRDDALRRFSGPFLFLLFLFATLGAACLYFRDDVVNQAQYVVKRENIRVVDPPSWIDGGFVDEILRLLPSEFRERRPELKEDAPKASRVDELSAGSLSSIDREPRLNSNDPKLVENLRIAAMKHPLVESVAEIRVYYPGKVDLRLNFRVPVALVDCSPKSLESFMSDVKEKFPNDYRFFSDVFNSPSAFSISPETGESEDGAEPGASARFLIDKSGRQLPNRYFVDHPGAYSALPKVAGLTASAASASSDPILEEAGAFARFLAETRATTDWQITQLGALRAYGSTRGLWYFKTSGGAFVKWGRFTRKVQTEEAPEYATRDRRLAAKNDWNALFNFQYRKFVELRRRILENDARVEMLKKSDDKETRESAEKYRLKVYDVSDALLGEEEEIERRRTSGQ